MACGFGIAGNGGWSVIHQNRVGAPTPYPRGIDSERIPASTTTGTIACSIMIRFDRRVCGLAGTNRCPTAMTVAVQLLQSFLASTGSALIGKYCETFFTRIFSGLQRFDRDQVISADHDEFRALPIWVTPSALPGWPNDQLLPRSSPWCGQSQVIFGINHSRIWRNGSLLSSEGIALEDATVTIRTPCSQLTLASTGICPARSLGNLNLSTAMFQ